jgi:transcriptional regulator with XRE-family HTH domain
MDATGFAGRLRELRASAGLTQKQLADQAGVALRTVSSLEQGLYEPVWPTVLALAQALGVDVQAFVLPPGRPGAKSSSAPAPQRRSRGRPRLSK